MLTIVTDATVRYASTGWYQTGTIRVDSVELVYPRSALAPASDGVLVKVCADFTGMDLLDEKGASVMEPGEDPVLPYLSTLIWVPPLFKVSKIDEWTDESFCQ